MKLALISDTHFGDPEGTLIVRKGRGALVPGPKYHDFKRAAGSGNDYLILLGDVLDFAVESYDEAYRIAQAFFLQIQKDKIAKQIVYVPGNHDEDIWHTVEHQVNIIYQIDNGRFPHRFRMSVPGIIDDRSSSKRKRLMLPGVTERKVRGQFGYGGLFLDKITVPRGSQTRFNFAYPNLYLATDAGAVLITHGHYLEEYWSLVSEWGPTVFRADLHVSKPMTLRDMVSINFPTNQLACSGVGQAGPLTHTIRSLLADLRNHRPGGMKQYLDRFGKTLSKRAFGYSLIDPRKWITSSLMWWAKREILKSLETIEDVRYSKEFVLKPEVRQRFRRFFDRSAEEIRCLNQNYGYELPIPTDVIFGHTHQPVPWGSSEIPPLEGPEGQRIRLFNAGGWLAGKLQDGRSEFCGAEVFKYETGKGMSSVSVR
jgi:predicted phosphodiesterase